MGRRPKFILFGIGIAASLSWIVFLARQATPATGIEGAAAEVNADIREKVAAVAARADTLAQLPRLTWAVATDVSTVRDLTTDELSFRPHPGEHIEIAQISRKPDGTDGAVHTLLHLPAANPPALPMLQSGAHLLIEGGRLYVVSVVAIEPRERIAELRGALAVAQELDLGAVGARLDGLRVGAQVRAAGGTVTLGRTAIRDLGATVVALPGAAADRATVIVSGPGQLSQGRWAPPIVLLVLLLTGLAVVALRRAAPIPVPAPDLRRSRTPAPTAPMSSSPSQPVVARELAAEAHPTPSFGVPKSGPVVEQVATGKESKKVKLPRKLIPRTGALMLPPEVFEKGAPTLRGISDGDPGDPWRDEYRALFEEYVKLRRTCGEAVDEMNRDLFVVTLQNQRIRLVQELGAKDVRFRLAFDNGKAAIRFTSVH